MCEDKQLNHPSIFYYFINGYKSFKINILNYSYTKYLTQFYSIEGRKRKIMTDNKSIINSFNHTQTSILLLYKNETCLILSTQFKCSSIPQQITTKATWDLCFFLFYSSSVALFCSCLYKHSTSHSLTEEDKSSSHLTSMSPP